MHKRVILMAAIGAGVLFWCLDAFLNAVIFKNGTLLLQLLKPTPHEAGTRLLAVTVAAIFFVIFRKTAFVQESADASLRESCEQYRLVINNINDIVYLAAFGDRSHPGRVELVGGRIEKIVGYGSEEFIKDPQLWFRIMHPDDVPVIRESTKKIIDSGKAGSRTYRVRRKNSSEYLWIEDKVVPRLNDSGAVTGFFGVARDISDRKRLQDDIKAAVMHAADEKAISESILEAIGDGVSIQDKEFRVLYQNQIHKDLAGNHEDEFCYQAYEKKERYCGGCPVALAYADGKIHTVERSAPSESGLLYLEITASPLRDSTGAIIAGIEVVRNITQRKKTEEKLKKSEEKYRTLFTEAKDVFYISTLQGKFMDINPAGVGLFGYDSKEELLDIDIERDLYVYPADRKKFVDFVRETNYAKDYEVRMKRKNGDKLTVLITSTPLRNEGGEVIAFRGIIRDVTEQKRLEHELLHSQKMEAIGLLAGGIAHDFNNILTAILGYANLLRTKLNDEFLKQYVEQIVEAAERASHLTKSILTFSRKKMLDPRPIDLNEIVGRMQKFLARLIGEDITLKAVLTGELMVMADGSQIEQVLMNLATNARDAMPGGGSLTIETAKIRLDEEFIKTHSYGTPGGYALLSVIDTGTGFSEYERQRIFEPFFTTKEFGKGTGLGLSIVYGIIKQHGGYINVYSEIKQGTTFKIYLPLMEKKAEDSTAVEAAAAPPRGSETILLAEDEASVRKLNTLILEEAGYTVIAARDGAEAVQKYFENRERIDLIILDVIMPNKNGKEAYQEIRKINPSTRAFFMSGYTNDSINSRGMLDSEDHIISKPIAPTDLLHKVREVLDRPLG
jgi:two-component system cell cycle sensor histidine kinase/response regulator CckA